MFRSLFVLLALTIGASNAFAEGFAINVQGNKQIGMGHTGVALSWDASSLQFNPGALIAMPMNFSFTAGTSLTLITNKFEGYGKKFESELTPKTPFYAYGAGKISEKLALGLGVYCPYGNSLDWGKQWAGKYLVQDISLQAIFIQPTISYRLSDNFSIGGGPIIAIGSFELNKAIPQSLVNPSNPAQPVVLPDGSIELSGSSVEYGFNVGMYYQKERFSAGISYRSEVKVNVDGDSKTNLDPRFVGFLQQASKVNELAKATYHVLSSDEQKTELPLAGTLNLGLAYRLGERWTFAADVNVVFWDSYKDLTFTFKNSSNPQQPAVPLVTPKHWKNTMTYRVGAEYKASEKLDLRAGFYYDETPTQADKYTPETPGANKIGLSAGASFKLTEKLSADLSLLYIQGEKRKATSPDNSFAGEYQNIGFLPGFGLSYNF